MYAIESFEPYRRPAARRRVAAAGVLAAAALLGGCGDQGLLVPYEPYEPLAENRGVALSGPGESSSLSDIAWSPAEQEIFYQRWSAPGPFGIKAIDVASRAVREVDMRHAQYWFLTPSPDGQTVFFSATDSPAAEDPSAIYAVSADGASSRLLSAGAQGPIIVSPHGSKVAYLPVEECAADGPLYVHDLVADERSAVIIGGSSLGRPVAFSPDGERLLVLRHCPVAVSASCEADVFSLTTGSLEPISLGTSDGVAAIRWTAAGIVVLRLDFLAGTLTERIVGTVTAREVRLDLLTLESPTEAYQVAGWSADGERVALSTQLSTHLSRSWDGQGIVRIVELGTGESRVVAVASGERAPRTVTFSPAGDRIAYVFGSTIYTQILE